MVPPHTIEPRKDSRLTSATLRISLFLALELMLFGTLFSAYALLRASAVAWPSGVLSSSVALVSTLLVTAATAAAWQARRVGVRRANNWLAASAFLAFVFLVLKGGEFRLELIGGLGPSANTLLAIYYTVTAVHAIHVLAGGVANAWVIAGNSRGQLELADGRLRALSLYWSFVNAIWIVILVLFYLT